MIHPIHPIFQLHHSIPQPPFLSPKPRRPNPDNLLVNHIYHTSSPPFTIHTVPSSPIHPPNDPPSIRTDIQLGRQDSRYWSTPSTKHQTQHHPTIIQIQIHHPPPIQTDIHLSRPDSRSLGSDDTGSSPRTPDGEKKSK